MKAIVVTQDTACRINPTTGETIEAFRPSVVTITEFVTGLVMKRLLKPVGGPLSDLATDAEFLQFFNDSDKNVDLAVSSFMSKFHADDEREIPANFEKAVMGSEQGPSDEEKAALLKEQDRLAAEQKAAAESAAAAAASATAANANKTGAK